MGELIGRDACSPPTKEPDHVFAKRSQIFCMSCDLPGRDGMPSQAGRSVLKAVPMTGLASTADAVKQKAGIAFGR